MTVVVDVTEVVTALEAAEVLLPHLTHPLTLLLLVFRLAVAAAAADALRDKTPPATRVLPSPARTTWKRRRRTTRAQNTWPRRSPTCWPTVLPTPGRLLPLRAYLARRSQPTSRGLGSARLSADAS